MQIFGQTDTGAVRSQNEDYYGFNRIEDGVLAVVCDGMGGANAGHVASEMAVTGLLKEARENPGFFSDVKEARDFLRRSMRKINQDIFEQSAADPEKEGMGTTLVLCYIKGNQGLFMNIGDSRAYLLRGGELTRVTTDHSIVEEMVKQGHLTEEQARNHPNKNIITMALGPDADILPNHYELELMEGDVILLCSDGLTNMVKDDKIRQILCENPGQAGVNLLVKEANDNGGADNITAVIVLND